MATSCFWGLNLLEMPGKFMEVESQLPLHLGIAPQMTHRGNSKGHAQLMSQPPPKTDVDIRSWALAASAACPRLGLALCTDSTARTSHFAVGSMYWYQGELKTHPVLAWHRFLLHLAEGCAHPMAVTCGRGSQPCWGQGCNTPKHGACPVPPDAAALWKTVLWIKWCCWFIPFPLTHVSHLSTLDCSLMKSLFLTSTG